MLALQDIVWVLILVVMMLYIFAILANGAARVGLGGGVYAMTVHNVILTSTTIVLYFVLVSFPDTPHCTFQYATFWSTAKTDPNPNYNFLTLTLTPPP